MELRRLGLLAFSWFKVRFGAFGFGVVWFTFFPVRSRSTREFPTFQGSLLSDELVERVIDELVDSSNGSSPNAEKSLVLVAAGISNGLTLLLMGAAGAGAGAKVRPAKSLEISAAD